MPKTSQIEEIQRLQCPACNAFLIIDGDGVVTAHAEEPTPPEPTDDPPAESTGDPPAETTGDPPETPKKRSSKWSKKKE